MIKDIQGLRKFTDCSMPSNEKERIHKAEIAAYNQAINDAIEVVKNCSIPDFVRQSEQLVCSCGSIKVQTTGGSQCPNNRCSSAN